MALVSMASALALPSLNMDEDTSSASPLYKRDTYNCKGSIYCENSAVYIAAADDALSKIPWTDNVLYGATGYVLTTSIIAGYFCIVDFLS